MTTPSNYKLGYPAQKYSLTPVVVHNFDPTTLDVRDPKVGSTYRLGTLWVNNSTNNVFVLASIVANSANWIDFIQPEPLVWQEVTSSLAITYNVGYITNSGSLITLTLPTTASVGTSIRVCGKGSGLWTIAQNADQRIHFAGLDTTVGVTGSLSAGGQFDTVELLCDTENTRWTVISSVGSLIVV